MNYLCVYHHSHPQQPVRLLNHADDIHRELRELGVLLDRHAIDASQAEANDQAILAACADAEGHRFASARVQRLGGPAALQRRSGVRCEHWLTGDEQLLCLQGEALLCLHHDGHVHALHCAKGDRVQIPAGLPRWLAAGETTGFLGVSLCVSEAAHQPCMADPDHSGQYPGWLD